jgi:hypothetical protein
VTLLPENLHDFIQQLEENRNAQEMVILKRKKEEKTSLHSMKSMMYTIIMFEESAGNIVEEYSLKQDDHSGRLPAN